jgi:hypothetical protein
MEKTIKLWAAAREKDVAPLRKDWCNVLGIGWDDMEEMPTGVSDRELQLYHMGFDLGVECGRIDDKFLKVKK